MLQCLFQALCMCHSLEIIQRHPICFVFDRRNFFYIIPDIKCGDPVIQYQNISEIKIGHRIESIPKISIVAPVCTCCIVILRLDKYRFKFTGRLHIDLLHYVYNSIACFICTLFSVRVTGTLVLNFDKIVIGDSSWIINTFDRKVTYNMPAGCFFCTVR